MVHGHSSHFCEQPLHSRAHQSVEVARALWTVRRESMAHTEAARDRKSSRTLELDAVVQDSH